MDFIFLNKNDKKYQIYKFMVKNVLHCPYNHPYNFEDHLSKPFFDFPNSFNSLSIIKPPLFIQDKLITLDYLVSPLM